jgi:hypothetical protein
MAFLLVPALVFTMTGAIIKDDKVEWEDCDRNPSKELCQQRDKKT